MTIINTSPALLLEIMLLVKSIIAFMDHESYVHAKSVQIDNNIINVFSSVISLAVIVAIAASPAFRQSLDHVVDFFLEVRAIAI